MAISKFNNKYKYKTLINKHKINKSKIIRKFSKKKSNIIKIQKGGANSIPDDIKYIDEGLDSLSKFKYISIKPDGWSLYNAIIKSIKNDSTNTQISIEETKKFVEDIIEWLKGKDKDNKDNKDLKINDTTEKFIDDDITYEEAINLISIKINEKLEYLTFDKYIENIIELDTKNTNPILQNNPILWNYQSSKIIFFVVMNMLERNIKLYNQDISDLKLPKINPDNINKNINLVKKDGNYYDILIPIKEEEKEKEEEKKKKEEEKKKKEKEKKEKEEKEKEEKKNKEKEAKEKNEK